MWQIYSWQTLSKYDKMIVCSREEKKYPSCSWTLHNPTLNKQARQSNTKIHPAQSTKLCHNIHVWDLRDKHRRAKSNLTNLLPRIFFNYLFSNDMKINNTCFSQNTSKDEDQSKWKKIAVYTFKEYAGGQEISVSFRLEWRKLLMIIDTSNVVSCKQKTADIQK